MSGVHGFASGAAMVWCGWGVYDLTRSVYMAIGVIAFIFVVCFSFITLISQRGS